MSLENIETKSVLLVDDNRFILEMYADEFRSAGFNTDIAVGAAEALRKMKENKYNAIVLDLIMIAVDGVALLEKMKNENLAEGSALILLTNSDDPDKIEKARVLGAETYLKKLSTVPKEAVSQVSKVIQSQNLQTI